MALEEYRRKRRFAKTPEPDGAAKADVGRPDSQWRFVVQKHAATNLHYDLRLELNGVLLSWAIHKGPSLDWQQKRLAIHVEDHPLEYLEFEGVIPSGQYGSGTVMVWDLGQWTPRHDAERDYAQGMLKFDLQGKKLRGGFMLKRLDGDSPNQWLLIKEKDSAMRSASEFNVLSEMPHSVLTGRNMDEITIDRDLVWKSPSAEIWQFDAERYPNARKSAMPGVIRPALATPSRLAPTGEQWVHEIKHDGYRMVCHVEHDQAVFRSRNGNDWTPKLKSLARWMANLPLDSAVFDGEIVKLDGSGVSQFQALQNCISAGKDAELRYYVFDLLYLNGYSLLQLPLSQRKQILGDLLKSHPSQRLVFSEHLEGDGPAIFQQVCKLNAEGIVSKRVDKRYVFGRSDFWIKTKCTQSREFLIGGFTPPSGSREGVGAILLGTPTETDKLRFVGKVGTGFTDNTLIELHRRLTKLAANSSPFENLNRRSVSRGTTWVQPKLIAEIEFAGQTDDGLLRFGSFRGLREDLNPEDLNSDNIYKSKPDESNPIDKERDRQSGTRNVAANASFSDAPPIQHHPSIGATDSPSDVHPHPDLEVPSELGRVRLSSPNRVVYPDMEITKLGVATYYAQIGGWMLPHVQGRPLSLLRCPDGVTETCFFQKRAPKGVDSSVEVVAHPAKSGSRPAMVIHDLVGLLSLIQFGALEFHVSGARVDRIERPDRMVFDLDPDEQLDFSMTIRAAVEFRDWLISAGLESFVKTTGGKGLHVVVPIRRRHTWEEVKDFTSRVGTRFAKLFPTRFTTSPSKKVRRGKILIDTLRNARDATAVAAYSTRARPQASVSVPVTWQELDHLASSDSMSLQSVMNRLAKQSADPWRDINAVQQSITKRCWAKLNR